MISVSTVDHFLHFEQLFNITVSCVYVIHECSLDIILVSIVFLYFSAAILCTTMYFVFSLSFCFSLFVSLSVSFYFLFFWWSASMGIAEFAGLEFAGVENDG